MTGPVICVAVLLSWTVLLATGWALRSWSALPNNSRFATTGARRPRRRAPTPAVRIVPADRRRRSKRAAVAALALLALACRGDGPTSSPGPALPSDARTLDPLPVEYDAWWRATEACADRQGDLTTVRWYTTPGDSLRVGATTFDAYWFAAGNTIVVARPYVRDGPVVRHEMLHALLRRGDHPAAYFQGRCARIVRCAEACQRG